MLEEAVQEISEPLSAMDPTLSFLASQAAVELDNMLSQGTHDLEAVQLLGDRLGKSTEAISGSTDRRALMDPATLSIISNAISASRSTQPRTLAEFASEAWKVANDLHGSSKEQDKRNIEKLRTFCVTLAHNCRSYRQTILDVEPSHPYRS